jgi:hypothetical protein
MSFLKNIFVDRDGSPSFVTVTALAIAIGITIGICSAAFDRLFP